MKLVTVQKMEEVVYLIRSGSKLLRFIKYIDQFMHVLNICSSCYDHIVIIVTIVVKLPLYQMHKAMEGKRPLSPDKTGEIWSRWHGGAIPTSPHLQMEPVKMTKARMKEAEKPQLPRIKDAPAETFLIPR